jgi:ParB family chromosome partitioning protein
LNRSDGAPRELPIHAIRPNPRQPRSDFDENALAELTASIASNGILQPLLVRPLGGGDYELIAGERRLRAAERAGLRQVPVVVRESGDGESLELALIENIQRDDLSPLEEALAYQRLVEEHGYTQDDIAERVGKSRPAVANTLRLLRLPDAIKDDIARGRLTPGHARALLSIEDADAQLRAARQMLARDMSVRDAEALVEKRRKPGRTSTRDPHRHALERELAVALGTRVRIRPRGRGGTIEIDYFSQDELQGLRDRLCHRGNFDNP